MADAYKLAKEAFVSNLNGGSISEITAVTLVAPLYFEASVFLWSALQTQQSFFTPYTALPCLVDFLLNCGAILFATTLYSSRPIVLNSLLLLPALLVVVSSNLSVQGKTKVPKMQPITKEDGADIAQPEPFPLKPFLTNYRATMMVVTCVAILAVDFRVFPRRFAKVENWGTSLMDLGVGSFVFSAGTVAVRPVLKSRQANKPVALASRLRSAFRHALPLFILGLTRLYSVKGLDYAEHVTEYGVHWNFFFTLALVPPSVALFDSAFGFLPSYAVLALLLGATYELLLTWTNLKRFILTAPRTDIFSKNREGIFSFFGYLAIFLVGQSTGMYVLPRSSPIKGRIINPTLKKLVAWSMLWWTLFFFSYSYRYGLNLRVSRRLANLPYILWVNAFNTSQLVLFCITDVIFFSENHSNGDDGLGIVSRGNATSRILRAFNRNGLALFLLANLLTGLANMCLPTLSMTDLQAMGVLLAYLAMLASVALVLDLKDISIKL